MALIPNLRSFKHTTNDGIAKPVIAPHTYPYGFGVGDDLYTVSAASNRPKADAPKLIQAAPQAFLDTPPLVYSDWNKAVGSNSNSAIDQPLGTLPSSLRICLIGGGISNLAAAFELAKAGAQVHLYEANAEVGGRLLSKLAIDGQSEAEMGAMRFPPSEDLLYYYSKSLGFAFMQGFPDPGLKPTIISYQGRVQEWHDRAAPPEGFATVYNGWIAFIEKGLQNPKPGQKVLESAIQLQKWLVDPKQRHQVPAAWQLYLDTFKNDTFLDGLQRIFGGDAQWEVPGGTVWSDDDFNRFGALGVGSGGFGPLFGIAFNTVFRLIPNGLETDQAIFCIPNVDHTDGTPVGIQQLALALKKKAIRAGATIVTNTFADLVSNDQGVVTVSLKPNGLALSMQTRMFDFVIVGTTTAAMAINMSVAGNFAPNAQFVSEQIANSITNVHITSSSKLFLRTKRFWASQVSSTLALRFDNRESDLNVIIADGSTFYSQYLVRHRQAPAGVHPRVRRSRLRHGTPHVYMGGPVESDCSIQRPSAAPRSSQDPGE